MAAVFRRDEQRERKSHVTPDTPIDTESATRTAAIPAVAADAPLLFVINGASGHTDVDQTRATIEAALREAGRRGELLFSPPGEIAQTARKAAATAAAQGAVLVGVGGDGTLNAVAQAAHAQGCAFGIVPQGTFNYFARTHGIPTETLPALQALLGGEPVPVQVGLVNGRLFLVNASLGLYPELLQDREAYKNRFGRKRWVALLALAATLLTHRSQLRIRIELAGGGAREVTTPTLFVGNNRLQLEQVGLPEAPALDDGRMAAVMSRPIGALAMLGLLLRGAMGRLGEADAVESFEFRRMVVKPRPAFTRRWLKVAFDGEVSHLPAPIEFSVASRPLYLLKPARAQAGGAGA